MSLNLSRHANIKNYRLRIPIPAGTSPYGIYRCFYSNEPESNPVDNVIKIQFDTTTYPDGAPVYIDDTSTPATTDFTVSGIASNPTITNVSLVDQVSYTELQITLSDDIYPTDNALISYTKGVNKLLDLSALEIDEWIDEPVTKQYDLEPASLLFNYTDTQLEVRLKFPSTETVYLDFGDGSVAEIVGEDAIEIVTSSNYSSAQIYSASFSGSGVEEITYINLHNETGLSGDITEWNWKMPNLEALYVSQTSIGGDISLWTNMTSLSYCAIHYSNVGGDIDTISNWSSLATLAAYGSDLSGSIDNINTLSGSLTYLHLQSCTDVYGDITHINDCDLTFISLSGTQVSGSIEGWSNLTDMTYLTLSSLTGVTGDISSLSALSSSLYSFNCNDCSNITGNISGWASSSELAYMYLWETGVSGDIEPLESLSGSLVVMSLGGTNVSGSISGFNSMSILNQIIVSDTDVGGDVSTFSSMESVNMDLLYLYNTNIYGDVGGWGNMSKLSYVSIYNTSCSGDITNWGDLEDVRLIQVNNLPDVYGDISGWSTSSWSNIGTIAAGNSEVSGDLAKFAAFSSSMTHIILNSTSMSFDTTQDWSSTNDTLNFYDCDWSSTEVDNCLISMYNGATTESSIDISGNNAARTAASDTAYTWLAANNDEVTTN